LSALPSSPEAASIATAAEREVRDALRSDSTTAALGGADLRRIPGGLSNFAWRATTRDGSKYFVRLAAPRTERLGADHVNECGVLALAAELGVAPPVVRCDPSARLLVTRWVDGAPGGDDRMRAWRVAAVAERLARLHASPVPADVRRVDFETQADELGRVVGPDGRVPVLAVVAARVFARLRDTQHRQVLCHHDLNPLNLVWERTGRLWIVDWEYAGLGDAAIDLASFTSQHGLGARGRAMLLRHYLAAGGVADAARLEPAAWAFDYVQWLWYRATLDAEQDVADRAIVASRAIRLRASLRVRASRLLRCNNARFARPA
jgi:thiamine kinase